MSVKDKLPFYNTAVLPYHFVQAAAAGVRYRFPGKKLRVIAVTGTNGKTTTCFMIWKMLQQAGHKTGLMTTVAWGVDELHNQVEHMTTADSFTLNKRIAAIADAGAEFLVLEVTSHALTQFRTLGIPIEIAVMTNVTHEHLDYHKTFERYVAAKCKLFEQAEYGIINIDDRNARQFIRAITRHYSRTKKNYAIYGVQKHASLKATGVKVSASGVEYTCKNIEFSDFGRRMELTNNKMIIKTQIPGRFNVYNSLAAAAVGLRLGLSQEQIEQGIYALESVEGRMNRLHFPEQDFDVIVDFAHTPDAFQKVFESVTPHPEGKVISLFGGAGRRDETTRAERGRIAARYSDIIIITEDDSRDEPPIHIAKMFLDGAKAAGFKRSRDMDKQATAAIRNGEQDKYQGRVLTILDRQRAIDLAIRLARPGDLVLILGKGHEKTIIRADGPHEFEDLKVAEDSIKRRLERQRKKRAKEERKQAEAAKAAEAETKPKTTTKEAKPATKNPA